MAKKRIFTVLWKHRNTVLLSLILATSLWTSFGLITLLPQVNFVSQHGAETRNPDTRGYLTNTNRYFANISGYLTNTSGYLTDTWTPVLGLNDTYVFNAYFTGRDQFVRIIGIGPSELKTDVLCRYWCSERRLIEVNGNIKQMIDSHKRRHNNIEILCPVPDDCRAEGVVLSKMEFKSDKILKIHRPPENKPKVQFSVCFAVVHSNYQHFPEIIQTFELDSMFGAQRFTLYYQSATPEVEAVLRMYIDSGKLRVVPWTIPELDVHYFGQVTSIRDCFYRNMHTSKYIAFKDLDEVMIPLKHANWNDLTNELLRNNKNVAAFMFLNSFLFKGGPDVTDGLSPAVYETAAKFKLYTILKQYRQNVVWQVNKRSKFIVNPEGVDNVEIHIIRDVRKGYKTITVNETQGLLFHYRASVDPKIPRKRDPSMLKFTDKLIERVKNVYNKLNSNYTEPVPLFP